jgi:hypothetical protein
MLVDLFLQLVQQDIVEWNDKFDSFIKTSIVQYSNLLHNYCGKLQSLIIL